MTEPSWSDRNLAPPYGKNLGLAHTGILATGSGREAYFLPL
jgi:hypothetical protein